MGYVSLTYNNPNVLIYNYPNYKATKSLNNSYCVHTFESVVTILHSILSQAQKGYYLSWVIFLISKH